MPQGNEIHTLETESISRLLVRFSLPSIASMTVVSLYNIISSIFIGQKEGPLAITGLAVTFPFMNLVLAVCMLVAIGGATVCSIELGARRPMRAFMVLGHSIVLSLVFSAVFSALGLVFLDPVLRVFGASDATLPYAREYMEIILWGAPIGALMVALNHLMRASGYPTKSMLMNLLSVGVNLVLTPLFIFGFQWGIRGAAVATVLSQVVSLVAMLFHFFDLKSVVHFRHGIYALRPTVVKALLAVGLAPFLMNACACLVIVVINLSLGRHGGDLAIGAYGIANRLLMLFAMVVFGLNQGMQPLLGYNFGARRMDRVRLTLRYGIIAATIVTTSGFLAFQFAPEPLVRLFTTHPDLIDKAVNGLRLCTAVFFLVGAQIVIAAYFQSLGRAGVAIFLSLSRQLVFLIPGLIVLPLFFGANGVWASLPLADVLSFAVAVVLLRFARLSKSNPAPLDPAAGGKKNIPRS